MRIRLLLFALFFWTIRLSAQPTIEWQKTYGGSYFDQAYSIEQTMDGGYIVAGNTGSTDGNVFGNHGGFDFWVLKLDNIGTIQWKKALGGSNHDWPSDIHQTLDGGYIVCGYTISNNYDVSGNHGEVDGWVVKLNATGNIEWQRALGGSADDEAWSVQQTLDGGYIVAGRSESSDGDVSSNQGGFDFWVVKLSSLGVTEWEKSLGGTNVDGAVSVKQTLDGGYIVTGETASYDGDITDNHGNIDYWVVKLSNTGAIEWQKTYGGYGADVPTEIQLTRDGGYVIVGFSGSNNSGDVTGYHGFLDFWVVKLNNTGDIQWQKALGGTGLDWGRSIVQTTQGGFIVFGTTESMDGDVLDNDGGHEAWALGLNETGDIIWQKTLGGTKADEGNSIQQTSDNGFILAGYAWSNDGDLTGQTIQGYNDFWIVKLSPETISSTQSPQSPLSIFPNPAHTSITLQIPTPESTLHVSISDLLGRTLSQRTITNGGQIDIAALPTGLYLLSATTEAGQVYVGKLRKE